MSSSYGSSSSSFFPILVYFIIDHLLRISPLHHRSFSYWSFLSPFTFFILFLFIIEHLHIDPLHHHSSSCGSFSSSIVFIVLALIIIVHHHIGPRHHHSSSYGPLHHHLHIGPLLRQPSSSYRPSSHTFIFHILGFGTTLGAAMGIFKLARSCRFFSSTPPILATIMLRGVFRNGVDCVVYHYVTRRFSQWRGLCCCFRPSPRSTWLRYFRSHHSI